MEHAHVVLVGADRRVDLGRLVAGERCTLGFLDDLLQLQLAARRFGLSVVLVDLPAELEELVDLLGLDRRLGPAD
jgi:hypothetical protein